MVQLLWGGINPNPANNSDPEHSLPLASSTPEQGHGHNCHTTGQGHFQPQVTTKPRQLHTQKCRFTQILHNVCKTQSEYLQNSISEGLQTQGRALELGASCQLPLTFGNQHREPGKQPQHPLRAATHPHATLG